MLRRKTGLPVYERAAVGCKFEKEKQNQLKPACIYNNAVKLLAHVTEGYSFRHGWIKPQMTLLCLPSPCLCVGCIPVFCEVATPAHVILTTIHPTKCDFIFLVVSTKGHEPASLSLEWDQGPTLDPVTEPRGGLQ